MKKILVTGSSGLIGSEVVMHFNALGWRVFGIDNNMRMDFFGPEGDTRWNCKCLVDKCNNFVHFDIDIRNRQQLMEFMKETLPDLIVHAAAQPSHDLAASRPFDDFDVNAVGTLNILEAARKHSKDTVFVHMSTNKVYGDKPNRIKMKESKTRWEYDDPEFIDGIDERMSIDQSKHSLFGASKVAADIMVQEYGRYFNMRTCCLRGGCLTGPAHSGVELHGFLSYLTLRNLIKREYKIFGYKGKQVRDNIHAYDVARCIELFYENPTCGAVFNIGGGKTNAISILEAFDRIKSITGIPMRYSYIDNHREGDHICYISNLSHIRKSLPGWDITRSLDDILEEMILAWQTRLAIR